MSLVWKSFRKNVPELNNFFKKSQELLASRNGLTQRFKSLEKSLKIKQNEYNYDHFLSLCFLSWYISLSARLSR
jgi:hypothetical protein